MRSRAAARAVVAQALFAVAAVEAEHRHVVVRMLASAVLFLVLINVVHGDWAMVAVGVALVAVIVLAASARLPWR